MTDQTRILNKIIDAERIGYVSACVDENLWELYVDFDVGQVGKHFLESVFLMKADFSRMKRIELLCDAECIATYFYSKELKLYNEIRFFEKELYFIEFPSSNLKVRVVYTSQPENVIADKLLSEEYTNISVIVKIISDKMYRYIQCEESGQCSTNGLELARKIINTKAKIPCQNLKLLPETFEFIPPAEYDDGWKRNFSCPIGPYIVTSIHVYVFDSVSAFVQVGILRLDDSIYSTEVTSQTNDQKNDLIERVLHIMKSDGTFHEFKPYQCMFNRLHIQMIGFMDLPTTPNLPYVKFRLKRATKAELEKSRQSDPLEYVTLKDGRTFRYREGLFELNKQ